MKTLLIFVLLLPGLVTAQQMTFEPHTTHGLPPAPVLISADVNGDGIEDIFVFGEIQTVPSTYTATLYLGNGNGSFTPAPQQPFVAMNGSDAIFINDENGFPQFLVTQGMETTQQGSVGKTHVYINDGNGNFSHHQELNGTFAGSLAAGKLNTTNNDIYLIITGQTINQSMGIFMYKLGANNLFFTVSVPAAFATTPFYRGTVTVFDYDNDGDFDIFMTGEIIGVGIVARLYQNNGNMNFTLVQENVFDTGIGFSSVAVGCLEQGNPYPWIVMAGAINSNQQISHIYRNDNGLFSLHQTLPGVRGASVRIGDFDNDGHLDVFAKGRGTGQNYHARIFRNDGNGNLSVARTFSPGLGGLDKSALVIDFNNDDKLDLIYTGWQSGINPEIYAFRNTTAMAYTVATVATPAEGGAVGGDGTYNEGSEVTVMATPASDFQFDHWLDEGGVVVSTQASYTFVMPSEDITLTAVFSPGMSVEDMSLANVVMYPNPTRGQLSIDLPNGVEVTGVYVTDIMGRSVSVPVVGGTIDLGRFSSGIYLVTVQSYDARVTKKVVKK